MKESLRGFNTTTYKLQVQSVGNLLLQLYYMGSLVKQKFLGPLESIGHFLLNCAKETWPNVFNMILMHAQETRLIFRNHICMLRHTHKRILELFVNCVHSWLLEVTSVSIAGSSGKRGQIPKVVKFMALLQYSSTVLISLRFMYFLILVYVVYCLSRYEA